jgi:hypothetical protein
MAPRERPFSAHKSNSSATHIRSGGSVLYRFAHRGEDDLFVEFTQYPSRAALSILAQTSGYFASSVGTTLCASVRGKKVTLRKGRKGELNEKDYHAGSNPQHDGHWMGRNP